MGASAPEPYGTPEARGLPAPGRSGGRTGHPREHELPYKDPHRFHHWHKTDIGPNPATAVNASRAVLAGGDVHQFGGYALAETTGAAGASVRLRDGSVAGEVICRVNLAANESTRDILGHDGVDVKTGRIFLEVISGTLEGVLYWR